VSGSAVSGMCPIEESKYLHVFIEFISDANPVMAAS
jgi:hypothetical protein